MGHVAARRVSTRRPGRTVTDVLVLVLGGTRSGKSELAERWAATADPVTYLATGSATDGAMADRIARHRARRPGSWTTVEAGAELVAALDAVPPTDTVLVDALGTWVAAHRDLRVDPDPLVAALGRRRGLTVVVSDEVGLGVHPSSELGVRFRDVLGMVNRAVADVADRVVLVVAGRVLDLAPAPSTPHPAP